MARERPTDAEFDELKHKRDAAISETVASIAKEWGVEPSKMAFHSREHGADCYCACPDGPCQHVWDGPEYREECMSSVTCSRCGAVALYHDMRCGP